MPDGLGDLGGQRARDHDDSVTVADDQVARRDLDTSDACFDADRRHDGARERVEWGEPTCEGRETELLDRGSVANETVDHDPMGSTSEGGAREQLTPRGRPDTGLDDEQRDVSGAEAVEGRDLPVVAASPARSCRRPPRREPRYR